MFIGTFLKLGNLTDYQFNLKEYKRNKTMTLRYIYPLSPRALLSDFFEMQRAHNIHNIRKANRELFSNLIPNILNSLDMDRNALIELIRQSKQEGEQGQNNAKIKIIKNGEVLVDSNINDLTPEQLNNVEKTLHNLVADGWGLSKVLRPDLYGALDDLSKDKESCACQQLATTKPESDDKAVKIENPAEEMANLNDTAQKANTVLESLKDTSGIEQLRNRETSLKDILENDQLNDEQKVQELKKLIL